jgi:putative acetyltransferase
MTLNTLDIFRYVSHNSLTCLNISSVSTSYTDSAEDVNKEFGPQYCCIFEDINSFPFNTLLVPPAAGRMPSSAALSDLARRRRGEQIVRAEIPLRGTPPLGWRKRKELSFPFPPSRGSAQLGIGREKMIDIRIATGGDSDEIRSVHLSAFPAGQREIVSKLAVDLLSEETTPATLSLVAEAEGAVVGHVAFSPVTIGNTKTFQGYILAPLAVKPDHQKRRVGSQLVEVGIQRLSGMGAGIIFVYGDPKYYGRFGFSVDVAEPYVPPYELQYPFGWQAIALQEFSDRISPVRIACVNSLCDPTLW